MKHSVIILVAALSSGCGGSTASARDPYELALDARLEIARIALLHRAVDAGNPKAMFALANHYRDHDPARALALYQRAADLEHPESLQALSMAAMNGELGLARDESLARLYAMEAAEALLHR